MTPLSYSGYRFPPDSIQRAVWMYLRFTLSFRDVEELLSGHRQLDGSGRDKTHEGGSHEGLCPSGHAGDLGPGLEGLGPGGSILVGGEVIAAEVEQVADLVVSGEEALRLAS